MTERTSAALRPDPTRADEERIERRRKRGDTFVDGRRLVVPDGVKDPNFEYRWAADRPGRVQQLYDNDYDVVEGHDQPHGGNQENVGPFKMVLMRKRKDWYEEDKAEKMQAVDEVEEHLRRGQAGNIAAERAGREDQGKFYSPGAGSVQVSAGRKSYEP